MAFRLVAVIPDVIVLDSVDSDDPEEVDLDDCVDVDAAEDGEEKEFKVGVISPEDSAKMVSLSNPVFCNQADRRVLDNW
jgi:hypothetical protein